MKVDVLVCGGGCAGLGAAIASARAGAMVMLVERAPFAGGIITTVGLPFLDGIACWETGRLVVKGLALELLTRLGVAQKNATIIEDIQCAVGNAFKRHGSVGLMSIERFKILADELLQEAGVKILYHAMACGTEVRNGRIEAVFVACKDGIVRIEPGVVIDCTGDADIANYAGCPMDIPADRMPMTMHFRIGNVKRSKEMYAQAAAACKLAHTEGMLPHYYGPGISFVFAEDEAYIHAVRVPGNAVDAFDLTRAEMQGRKDAFTLFTYWRKHVQGFENSYLIGSGPFIGVRETRRIVGQHVLCEDDLIQRRSFDDAIATGSWYIDLHPNKVTEGSAHHKDSPLIKLKPYDIPFRSLVARGVDNLLVAGRCHSATRNAAGSTRVTVTAMAMGEAAGVGAALALRQRTSPAELNGADVRRELIAAGGGPFTYEA